MILGYKQATAAMADTFVPGVLAACMTLTEQQVHVAPAVHTGASIPRYCTHDRGSPR